MQAQQQQGGPAGMPPHVSQLMHLQQLAQSLGSSTAVTPWQLPLSQSQPPANYPTQQQWKEAMLMHAAKAGHPTGPAKVCLPSPVPPQDSNLHLSAYHLQHVLTNNLESAIAPCFQAEAASSQGFKIAHWIELWNFVAGILSADMACRQGQSGEQGNVCTVKGSHAWCKG